ncbi:MAG: HD domain-containing protein, partial [Patescibacteria group bacterium]|nr:HD domain-containing protein [Patescibacteria group bacterium]
YKDFEVQSDPYLPIKEDLSRRDFTINSMAILINKTDSLMDLFGGIGDLEEKIIRTVGKAEKRFAEDYTRMIRATRFSAQLGFEIEEKTYLEIKNNAGNIKKVAIDLIRDEFNKIIMSSNAKRGVMLLHNLKLLRWIIPELETGVGVDQNKSHIFTVFEHAIRTLDFAAKNNYSLEIRIAGLLHDVAKPITKKGKGVDATFYNHDIVGARITRKILRRLNYSNEKIKKIEHLVRYHMFYYSLGEITDAGVRRFIARVGREHIDDLIKLRMADRIGMGRPKAKPFKLIELQRRVKLVQLDPISVKMLKVNGADIIEELGLSPCPKFGLILNALLAEVLEDPKKNDREYLIKRMKELNKMNDKELNDLSPDLDSYEEYRRKETIKKM